jgi:nitrate reductase gamma subunit
MPWIQPMSNLLKILENEVQIAALVFLALVYIVRLIWLFRFKIRKDRTFAVGHESAGAGYSLMNVAMPWAMESTRKRPGFYAQFVVFHLGITAAIAGTFIIPYAPGLFRVRGIVLLFQGLIAAAFLVGLLRLVRRLTHPVLRTISSPDDYFSLVLLVVWFAAGVLAVPNEPGRGEWPLILYFGLTAFFLVYVPFSKICHYLYYPFTRYYLGRSLGHRGAIPPSVRRKAADPAAGKKPA